MTGAIVEYLCDKFDTFGIIRTCNLGDDPNFSNDLISLSYKEEIIQLIKKYGIIYLFDIHGCADKYDFDISQIEENDYVYILDKSIENESLEKFDFYNLYYYDASKNIVYYVHNNI